MENLWKKEEPGGCYVDCFKNVDANYAEETLNWIRCQKKYTMKQNDIYRNNLHSRQLRKRKSTIENKNMAKKIARRRGNKKNRLKGTLSSIPKLSYGLHPEFPDITNVLEIKENPKFGRHIVANCNIDVGKIIAMGKPYADAVICHPSSKKFYCFTCKNTDSHFIECDNCKDVKFCSEECRSNNFVHQLECNSIYHRIQNSEEKLIVQMVLIAIRRFSTADEFMKYYERLLANNPVDKCGLMLKLSSCSRNDNISHAYRAFQCLMTIRSIKIVFKSMAHQRFLMHLVLHTASIIPSNSWTIQLNDDKDFEMRYIHDVISLFNHSCAPNAFYSIEENHGFCVTVRPIKKGEQIFVNYLGDEVNESRFNRQSYLKRQWGFECECERCMPKRNRINNLAMIEDSSLKYINSHYDDYLLPFRSKLRQRLRDECAKFLQKHGYYWTEQLDTVIRLFILTNLRSNVGTGCRKKLT